MGLLDKFLLGVAGRMAGDWQTPLSQEEFEAQRLAIAAATPVPVMWLFGKTQAGKTAVVHHLTGADRAQIGDGFRPTTKHSFAYDFPDADEPLIRFLDTRGVGEADYDAAEDVAAFDADTHLILVVARVADRAQETVIGPLRRIRAASPQRPVLLVATCLHEAYPGKQHPVPDPFGAPLRTAADVPADLPGKLGTLLAEQMERFDGLCDACVPVDLTKPDDGFEQVDFGGERLKAAIAELLPEAYRESLLRFEEAMGQLSDLHLRRVMPTVVASSSLAATAAGVPTPWIDLPVVAGIQIDMVRRIAKMYGQQAGTKEFLSVAGAIGGRMVMRQLFRETLKIIPGVGMAANAALSYAYTFALGRACCWYFGEIRAGHAPDAAELKHVFREQLGMARSLWNRHNAEPDGPPASPPALPAASAADAQPRETT